MTTTNLIVVGVDGTPGSRAALDVALDEGVARGATVEVVTVWAVGSAYDGEGAVTTPELARAAASSLQDEIVQQALAERTERPTVAQTVLPGYAGNALVERSDGAAMIVVGSGRKGVMSRAFIGSTSEHVVRHARGPVLVVPDPQRVEHHAAHATVATSSE